MSSNFYAHYGYFLECSGPRTIVVEGDMECPKRHHIPKSLNRPHFCPSCGLKLVPGVASEEVNFGSLRYNFMDTVDTLGGGETVERDMNILLKNFYAFNEDNPDSKTYLGINAEGIFSLSLADDESEEFMDVPQILPYGVVQTALEGEIELLKSYLYDEVELRFGLVSYWA